MRSVGKSVGHGRGRKAKSKDCVGRPLTLYGGAVPASQPAKVSFQVKGGEQMKAENLMVQAAPAPKNAGVSPRKHVLPIPRGIGHPTAPYRRQAGLPACGSPHPEAFPSRRVCARKNSDIISGHSPFTVTRSYRICTCFPFHRIDSRPNERKYPTPAVSY